MSTAREKDQADFDLERFIDMFDTAMTSDDPRVVETLRKLMMIIVLIQPETPLTERTGPLRRLYEDMNHLNRRMHRMEEEVDRALRNAERKWEREVYQWEERDKWSMQAAQQVAAKIDQDVINQLKATARAKGLK